MISISVVTSLVSILTFTQAALIAGSAAANDSSLDSAVSSQEIDRPETLELFVRRYFSEDPILAEIAMCESTFRQYGSTGEALRGKVNRYDVGVMQINEIYHGPRAEKLGLDLEDLHDNLAYAKVLYENEGVQPWASSKPCWGKTAAYRQYKELSVK